MRVAGLVLCDPTHADEETVVMDGAPGRRLI